MVVPACCASSQEAEARPVRVYHWPYELETNLCDLVRYCSSQKLEEPEVKFQEILYMMNWHDPVSIILELVRLRQKGCDLLIFVNAPPPIFYTHYI